MNFSHYQVHFSGQVQGVGFRYTAVQLARKFKNLTGYVRNMPDGRVEMIAETDEITFKDFLAAIRESPLGFSIKNTEVKKNLVANRQFTSFDIHF